MQKRLLIVLVAALALPVGRVHADPRVPPPTVSVREVEPGTYAIDARFEVDEPGHIAWAVLTDYANLARFVPDIRSSVVRERRGGQVRVEQEAVSKYLLFSKRVYLVLDIEEAGDVITFRDSAARSFTRYAGEWRMTARDGRTEVVYSLTAQPSFEVPAFMVRRVLTRDAVQLVDRLRTEMRRRAATP